jgi:hypothetical protein
LYASRIFNYQGFTHLCSAVKGRRFERGYELGELPLELAARVQHDIGIDTQGFRLTLDSYGVRHAFGGHSQEWGSRDHYPLTEADMLSLPSWVFAPTTVLEGATRVLPMQPRRLRLEYVDSQQLKIVLILEVRPRYRRLVLVTMYKTING